MKGRQLGEHRRFPAGILRPKSSGLAIRERLVFRRCGRLVYDRIRGRVKTCHQSDGDGHMLGHKVG